MGGQMSGARSERERRMNERREGEPPTFVVETVWPNREERRRKAKEVNRMLRRMS